jgi:D-aminopeptidase
MSRYRARDLGIRIGTLSPGRFNAITDVPGVRVGQVSLVEGDGALEVGRGPVRTGVTAIWPHAGNPFQEKSPASAFVLNGFGKTIGLAQIAELGTIETPILLTNTLNVPRVADALIGYLAERNPDLSSVNPIVGECNDSYLNDIVGRHVRAEHVVAALDGAIAGPVEEGAVGAGVGMSCYEYKGGIGTSSRILTIGDDTFTVAALVLSNFGSAPQLRIDGVPVGQVLQQEAGHPGREEGDGAGSCMMIVATDVPLDARQLARVARRAGLGLARTGSTVGHGSGDYIIAFSNACLIPNHLSGPILETHVLADAHPAMNAIFAATIDTVEEAVLNSLFRAETTVGRDGNTRHALPAERVIQVMRRFGHPEVTIPT